MTTPRRDGGGTPFGEWVRSRKELDAHEAHTVVTDIDYVFHRYIVAGDNLGTRDLQLMLDVEVKTYCAEVNDCQRETLFFRHQQLYDKREHLRTIRGKEVGVWSFGVNFLRMAGAKPRNEEFMEWGVFAADGKIVWHRIDWVVDLIEILSFKRSPDNPASKLSFRRHHKTKKLIVSELLPLGFYADKVVTKRS